MGLLECFFKKNIYFLNTFLLAFILHGANNKDLLKAVKKGDSCQVKELLKNGADINIQDEDGDTALHLIAMSKTNTQNIFYILINHQPNTLLKNDKGNTALHYAASFGDISIVSYLLDYDFSITKIKNKENHTAIYYALKNEHETIVDLFFKKIAVQEEWQKWHISCLVELLSLQPNKAYTFLKKYKDKADKYGNTLLFYINDDSIEIAKILLQLKANVNHKNHNNSTPLFFAKSISIAKLFLNAKASIGQMNQQNINDGNTPLHHALFMPNEEVATCLIKAGAKTDIKNRAGQTPVDVLWCALIPINEPLDENGDGKRERLLKLIDENSKN